MLWGHNERRQGPALRIDVTCPASRQSTTPILTVFNSLFLIKNTILDSPCRSSTRQGENTIRRCRLELPPGASPRPMHHAGT